MAADPQFKVIIWRTIHKGDFTAPNDSDTTQRQPTSTQKVIKNLSNCTQKQDEFTIRTESKTPESTHKSKRNTQKQIIEILKEHPKTSRTELATLVGITEDGIKKQLEKLKKTGIIERVGPDRGGYWNVCTPKEEG